MDGYYMNYTHGEKTQKWYNNINIGDDSESALKFIRSTGATIFEDEKYVKLSQEEVQKFIDEVLVEEEEADEEESEEASEDSQEE